MNNVLEDSMDQHNLTNDQKEERSLHAISDLGSHHIVKKVERYKDAWVIHTDDSSSFNMGDYGREPKPGDVVTLYYVNGRWTMFRGMDLNGVPLYFKTDAEVETERQASIVKHKAEQRQRFIDSKDELDAHYDALPDVFKQRIDKFRTGNPDFRWEYEAYEMFTCTQAVLIAEALKDEQSIVAFPDLPWEKQLAAVPGLSDGHSGNTFGAAVLLARLYVTNQEFVVKMHGAMVPLVGCEEYGCTHDKEADR